MELAINALYQLWVSYMPQYRASADKVVERIKNLRPGARVAKRQVIRNLKTAQYARRQGTTYLIDDGFVKGYYKDIKYC